MTRSTRIFLTLSLLIMVLDGTFVAINYYMARTALEESIRNQGRQRHTAFHIALAGFVLVELFLFFGIRYVTRRLEATVAERTATVEHLNRELYAQSITDSLTGLFNRRHFLRRLHEELERSERYGGAFVLLMLDLDHFKEINDRHGHAAGDALLVAVAHTLQEAVREPDICCRYGGEEFALFLPGTDDDRGQTFAERLRLHIADTRVTRDDLRLSVTASIGLAPWRPGLDTEHLIAAADAALYSAKRAGRNRVMAVTEVRSDA